MDLRSVPRMTMAHLGRGDIRMTRKNALLIAITAGYLTALTACERAPSVSYNTDVAPVLNKYCAECHLAQGEGTIESGFEI